MTPTASWTTAAGFTPGRPVQRQVSAALYVDLGENRGGEWLRKPRARYECLACNEVEGPVEGAVEVTAFTTGIRSAHRTRCASLQEHRQ